MKYIATSAFIGCLPEGEPTLHDTPAEAWGALLDEMGDDRWAPDDEENDPDGPQSMRQPALDMEANQRDNYCGVVYDGERFYEVDWAEDEIGATL